MNLFRVLVNSVAPQGFYIPEFKPNTVIVSNGRQNQRTDLPRFEGDTRLSTQGQVPFLIHSIQYGNHSSNKPQAEFEHDRLAGTPHYEIQALTQDGLDDNYSGLPVSQESKFFIAARLADSLFHSPPVVTAARRVA